MFLWFENHSVFTLKHSVIANLSGSQSISKRNTALLSKNKVDSSDGSGPNVHSNAVLIQGNSLRDGV